jgi:hypothetical protein
MNGDGDGWMILYMNDIIRLVLWCERERGFRF